MTIAGNRSKIIKLVYFGYDHQYITRIKDVKIGALGYEGWNFTSEIRSQVENRY